MGGLRLEGNLPQSSKLNWGRIVDGEQLYVGRSSEVEKNGFGVAWIMFWTWVGSKKDKVVRFQFPWVSHVSLTLSEVSLA